MLVRSAGRVARCEMRFYSQRLPAQGAGDPGGRLKGGYRYRLELERAAVRLEVQAGDSRGGVSGLHPGNA